MGKKRLKSFSRSSTDKSASSNASKQPNRPRSNSVSSPQGISGAIKNLVKRHRRSSLPVIEPTPPPRVAPWVIFARNIPSDLRKKTSSSSKFSTPRRSRSKTGLGEGISAELEGPAATPSQPNRRSRMSLGSHNSRQGISHFLNRSRHSASSGSLKRGVSELALPLEGELSSAPMLSPVPQAAEREEQDEDYSSDTDGDAQYPVPPEEGPVPLSASSSSLPQLEPTHTHVECSPTASVREAGRDVREAGRDVREAAVPQAWSSPSSGRTTCSPNISSATTSPPSARRIAGVHAEANQVQEQIGEETGYGKLEQTKSLHFFTAAPEPQTPVQNGRAEIQFHTPSEVHTPMSLNDFTPLPPTTPDCPTPSPPHVVPFGLGASTLSLDTPSKTPPVKLYRTMDTAKAIEEHRKSIHYDEWDFDSLAEQLSSRAEISIPDDPIEPTPPQPPRDTLRPRVGPLRNPPSATFGALSPIISGRAHRIQTIDPPLRKVRAPNHRLNTSNPFLANAEEEEQRLAQLPAHHMPTATK